jgi:hypothetical protein
LPGNIVKQPRQTTPLSKRKLVTRRNRPPGHFKFPANPHEIRLSPDSSRAFSIPSSNFYSKQ